MVNDSKPRKRRRRDVENDLEEVYYKGSSSNSFYVIVLRNSPFSLRDTLMPRIGWLNELYLVQIAGNSSILELKSHVNLTSGGYHVEYWSHQNVTKESHNQIQNCHYRGRHRGHMNYLYTYTIT